MHKTMASIASLEKIEIIRSQEFMVSEARLKFLKKLIILGHKTTILGPHFWWLGAARAPRAPPGSAPDGIREITPGALNGMESLTNLDLEDNSLVTLKKGAFGTN